MVSCSVPGGVRKVADQYKSVFDEGSLGYADLCAFLCLALYNCKGLSELARYCPWSPSVSELARAISGWNGERFMRRLRASVLRRFRGKLNPEDFCFAVDDTANPKYGRGIHRIGHWHGASGPYYGQNILVIVLVDRKSGVAIPIHYAFARKKSDVDYKSMPMLGAELLSECLACGFPPLPVTCDSWFDSAPFMRELEKLGLSYDGEIKSTRNIRVNPGQFVKDKKSAKFFAGEYRQSVLAKPYGEHGRRRKKRGRKKRKYIAETVALINGIKHPVKIIAVYNHRRDTKAFAYYLSTNRSMSGAELWALARSRWAIECFFRDVKQNLAFGRLPCSGREAADLAVCVPMALVVSLRLDDPEVWGLKGSEGDALGTKIAKIRAADFEKALNLITLNPGHDVVERLRARRQKERLSRKPTNKPAADYKAEEIQAVSGL